MDWQTILFFIWYSCRLLLIFLVVLFMLSGLDDFFFDLVYYMRKLYRRLAKRHLIKPITLEQLNACPEKPIALMVPAWDESAVIGQMLLNTLTTLDYKHYHIFVGTYPNDEPTRLAVNKVKEIYPQVSAVITPADGPTNKADCLNWVIQSIFAFEKEHGIEFQAFVMHDAEDIIHPLSFKYYNHLIPRVKMIQIPVFALEWQNASWVSGIYIDEFAELHSKDVRAREILAQTVPSAGVGTALSRDAIDFLRGHHRQQVFDIGSVTEDYQLGLHLREMEGKKIFLQQAVQRVVAKRHWPTGKLVQRKIDEPIATREFFPNAFGAATRQRARWIMGIAIQGWRIGWTNSIGANYCMFRDRKGLITNLLALAGYPIVILWLLATLAGWLNPNMVFPPLVESREIWIPMMWVVLGLLAWRIYNRAAAVYQFYGVRQAMLSIPRLVVGNVVNFWATVLAVKRYVKSKITGTAPVWGKTEHAYPTEDQLRLFHRKLGDLLLDRRLITTQNLEDAMAQQKKTGQKLGDILVKMGVLWEEDLVSVLAQQSNLQAVEIDPYSVPGELLQLIPLELALKHQVFPVGHEGESVILAISDKETMNKKGELEAIIKKTVVFRLTSTPDFNFALKRAYAEKPIQAASPGDRIGERLVRDGRVTPEQMQQALRRQKREDRPLGEILSNMNLIKQNELNQYLQK